MNKCTKLLHAAVALLLYVLAANIAPAQTGDNIKPPFDSARIADMIITGFVSEEQFQQLDLTADQQLEVFKAIKKEREWTMPDEDLEFALPQSVREKLSRPSRRLSVEGAAKESAMKANASWQPGGCNQMIVVESGNKNASWAFGWAKPRPGECGSDTDDTIIAYNTPNYPRTNPNNVRLSSPFWWVRAGLQAAFPVSRGLAANGLCSPVTRACMGSRGFYLLGNEVFYTYLWEK